MTCRGRGGCNCTPDDRLIYDMRARVAGMELRTLPSKLTEWDANADPAYEELLRWIQQNRDELLAMARGRHVWGHFRFADRNYFEYDADRLTCEAAEEIADAINYFARRRVLRGA